MKSLLKKILFLALLTASITSYAQNGILSKNSRVSIITCDTGNESYSLFGHTAIRITDIEKNLDIVFNYGAFDFNTPNFVAKFSKGDLEYFAVATAFSDFMNQYAYEKRSVFEQELNIPQAKKQKLLDNLTATLSSSESYYTYKFIDKNCTSMVVELLNKTLGYTVIFKKVDTDTTYRSILYPYFNSSFYEKLGTSIIFGKKVDEFGTKLFLPLELHKSLKLIQYENHFLCKESKTILEFKKETSISLWNNFYTYTFLLAFLVLLNKKNVELFYLFAMGILGLFFAYMGFYSFHEELAYNYNILLFNPLLLVLLYFYYTKNNNWIVNLSLANLFFLFIYLLFMLNKIHLFIVLPLVLTTILFLVKIIIRESKRIPVVI